MAEPDNARPDTTVRQGARDRIAGETPAGETARESYHHQEVTEEGRGAGEDGGLGRKDPMLTGDNARNDGGVQSR